jgi:hypothetical protein
MAHHLLNVLISHRVHNDPSPGLTQEDILRCSFRRAVEQASDFSETLSLKRKLGRTAGDNDVLREQDAESAATTEAPAVEDGFEDGAPCSVRILI